MYKFFCGFFSALQIKSLPAFLLFQNREQIATALLGADTGMYLLSAAHGGGHADFHPSPAQPGHIDHPVAGDAAIGNVGCFPVKGLYDRMHHPDFPDDARHPVVLKRPSLCPPRNEKDRPGVPATMIQGNRKPYHAALSHTSPVSFRQKRDC